MFVGHFFPPGSGYGSRDPIESGYIKLACDILPGSVHLVLLLLVEGAIFCREFPVGFLQAQLLGVNCQHLRLLFLLGMLWNQLVRKYDFNYDYVFREKNITVFTSVGDPDVFWASRLRIRIN